VFQHAIANFDGIITYYTSGSPDEAGNHNFFLYQEAGNKFTIIPWDLESTLSLSSNYGSIPPWQTTPADCSMTYPVWGGNSLKVIAPGCNRIFRALSADLTSYQKAAQKLLEGPFAESQMDANIDTLAAFVRAEATGDPHGPGAEAFEDDVGFLKKQIPNLRQRLQWLADGKSMTPVQIDVASVNDFESADAYGLLMSTSILSNLNTTSSVVVNEGDPLGGAK